MKKSKFRLKVLYYLFVIPFVVLPVTPLVWLCYILKMAYEGMREVSSDIYWEYKQGFWPLWVGSWRALWAGEKVTIDSRYAEVYDDPEVE